MILLSTGLSDEEDDEDELDLAGLGDRTFGSLSSLDIPAVVSWTSDGGRWRGSIGDCDRGAAFWEVFILELRAICCGRRTLTDVLIGVPEPLP